MKIWNLELNVNFDMVLFLKIQSWCLFIYLFFKQDVKKELSLS